MRFSDIFKVVPISTHARNSRPIESDGCEKNRAYFFVNRTAVMHADYPLPPNYTIFGCVTEGQEVVDAIACVARDRSDKPVEPVVMEKVTIVS